MANQPDERFARIPNRVVEILIRDEAGAIALGVYAYIAYRCNPNTGSWCFETLNNMAKRLGIGRRRLQIMLHRFVSEGLLEKRDRRPRSTQYRVTHLPVKNAEDEDGSVASATQSSALRVNQSRNELIKESDANSQSKQELLNQSQMTLQTRPPLTRHVNNVRRNQTDWSLVEYIGDVLLKLRHGIAPTERVQGTAGAIAAEHRNRGYHVLLVRNLPDFLINQALQDTQDAVLDGRVNDVDKYFHGVIKNRCSESNVALPTARPSSGNVGNQNPAAPKT